MVAASMNERWKVEIEASSKKFYQLRFAETIYAPGPFLKLKRVQCSETGEGFNLLFGPVAAEVCRENARRRRMLTATPQKRLNFALCAVKGEQRPADVLDLFLKCE